MKIRTRFFIAFIALGAAAVYFLLDWVGDELRPRYQAAMEESMVDTAAMLATLVELDSQDGTFRTGTLRRMLDGAGKRRFNATIYEFEKTRVNVRVYVTDAQGTVVFDSEAGQEEGKDYSRWNDVFLTLQGRYGARATRLNPEDPMTAILHVAAPVRVNGALAGVLSVAKPADSLSIFLDTARREITLAGGIAALAVITLGLAVSVWITRPIEQLTRYAKSVGAGKRVAPPDLGRSEIGTLARAFEEMRRALEGKEYVEGYVQTLTHQMKAPLSGRGTAAGGHAGRAAAALPEKPANGIRTPAGFHRSHVTAFGPGKPAGTAGNARRATGRSHSRSLGASGPPDSGEAT